MSETASLAVAEKAGGGNNDHRMFSSCCCKCFVCVVKTRHIGIALSMALRLQDLVHDRHRSFLVLVVTMTLVFSSFLVQLMPLFGAGSFSSCRDISVIDNPTCFNVTTVVTYNDLGDGDEFYFTTVVAAICILVGNNVYNRYWWSVLTAALVPLGYGTFILSRAIPFCVFQGLNDFRHLNSSLLDDLPLPPAHCMDLDNRPFVPRTSCELAALLSCEQGYINPTTYLNQLFTHIFLVLTLVQVCGILLLFLKSLLSRWVNFAARPSPHQPRTKQWALRTYRACTQHNYPSHLLVGFSIAFLIVAVFASSTILGLSNLLLNLMPLASKVSTDIPLVCDIVMYVLMGTASIALLVLVVFGARTVLNFNYSLQLLLKADRVGAHHPSISVRDHARLGLLRHSFTRLNWGSTQGPHNFVRLYPISIFLAFCVLWVGLFLICCLLALYIVPWVLRVPLFRFAVAWLYSFIVSVIAWALNYALTYIIHKCCVQRELVGDGFNERLAALMARAAKPSTAHEGHASSFSPSSSSSSLSPLSTEENDTLEVSVQHYPSSSSSSSNKLSQRRSLLASRTHSRGSQSQQAQELPLQSLVRDTATDSELVTLAPLSSSFPSDSSSSSRGENTSRSHHTLSLAAADEYSELGDVQRERECSAAQQPVGPPGKRALSAPLKRPRHFIVWDFFLLVSAIASMPASLYARLGRYVLHFWFVFLHPQHSFYATPNEMDDELYAAYMCMLHRVYMQRTLAIVAEREASHAFENREGEGEGEGEGETNSSASTPSAASSTLEESSSSASSLSESQVASTTAGMSAAAAEREASVSLPPLGVLPSSSASSSYVSLQRPLLSEGECVTGNTGEA